MIENIFYFNIELNLCATKQWVIDYIYINDNKDNMSRDEIKIALETQREFLGWYECDVSNDIFDKVYN